ncbi:MAG: hypothetical protein ACK4SY_04355 [Pyrobaculum sp.]
MFGKIKMGLEEWKKLEDELTRISAGGLLQVVINLTLVSTDTSEHEERHEHPHEEEHNDFTREVGELVRYITDTYKTGVYPHVHSHHGNVTFSIAGTPRDLIKTLREVLEHVKLSCEKCVLHTVDGEFHLGDDLAGIYFGDAYKITVILPNSDGRRLKVRELHF